MGALLLTPASFAQEAALPLPIGKRHTLPDAAKSRHKPSSAAKRHRNAGDFVGRWTGKWDNLWPVEFNVLRAFSDGSVSVIYAWEEKVGKPAEKVDAFGQVEGNVLKIGLIDISLSANKPGHGVAVGHFKTLRKAVLIRQSS
jgi:hypothetical protein